MSSRDEILASIREHTRTKYGMPDLGQIDATTYPDLIVQFCNIMEQVGGDVFLLEDDEDINEVIREMNPEARRIASSLPEITCATYNPDDITNPAELDGTDVAVIDGRLGVAENGAVWIEQDVRLKAIYFISEKLVIVLDRNKLVSTMHEAYRKISTGKAGFGVFISGPSKTADIEQALVMGAHGARNVTVILK